MKINRIKEIEDILNKVPKGPWHYHNGDDFDHWEIFSNDPITGKVMIHDDAGVCPDKDFIDFILSSRGIIEELLTEVTAPSAKAEGL